MQPGGGGGGVWVSTGSSHTGTSRGPAHPHAITRPAAGKEGPPHLTHKKPHECSQTENSLAATAGLKPRRRFMPLSFAAAWGSGEVFHSFPPQARLADLLDSPLTHSDQTDFCPNFQPDLILLYIQPRGQ